MPGDPDQHLFVYTTAPGTPSRQAMELLGILTTSAPGDSTTRSAPTPRSLGPNDQEPGLPSGT